MRYLYGVLLTLFLTGYEVCAEGHDSLFMASAITKLQHSKEYTLKVADMMPEQKYDFRPVKEEMNFGEQLLHICGNLGWLSANYLSTGDNPFSKSDQNIRSKDSIRMVIVRTYDYALAVLRGFPANKLADRVNFFAGPMSKLQIITLIIDHQTHHRGQLLVYLRLNGLTPPNYIGW